MIDRSTGEILKFIHDTIRGRGYPPSRQEIAEFIGSTSKGTAHLLVLRLEADGLIERFPGRVQGMRITRSGMKAATEAMT
jgi:SOS-response transcriptional repressor LexA